MTTVTRGEAFGKGVLEWGAGRKGLTSDVLHRQGVEGQIAGTPFRVYKPSGLLAGLFSRGRRLVVIEVQGRPLRRLRLRRFSTVSLEGPEGIPLVHWCDGFRGKIQVWTGADAADVALMLLATFAGLHKGLGLGLGNL